MATRGSRRALEVLAVGLFGAALLLPFLGAMDAVFSTDARYLEIGREMSARGDPLMPTLAGAPHLDKPPLTYWTIAAGYRLLGVSPFAGRLAQQLALLATAMGLFVFARRRLPAGPAAVAPVAFLTMALVFGVSRGASTDLLQLLLLTGALLLLGEASEGRAPERRLLLAMGLLGLSMLVKGPIAILLVGLVWAAHRALGGPAVPARASTRALGVVLLLAVAAPWYLWLVVPRAGLLGHLVVEQLLSRLGEEGMGHPHGIGYLLGAWLWGTLPWTPLVLLTLWRLRPTRPWRAGEPSLRLLWLWAVVPVAVFSIPSTKLPTYLLPALPPAALLLAHALARGALDDRAAARAARAAAGVGALVALAVATVVLRPGWIEAVGERLDAQRLAEGGPFGLALLALGLVGLGLAARAPRPLDARRLLAQGACMAATLVLGFAALAPAFESHREAGVLARSVPGARLLQLGTFQPGLLFAFGDVERSYVAEFPGLLRTAELLEAPDRVSLDKDAAVALFHEPGPVFALVKKRESPRVLARMGGTRVWCGRKHCLVANAGAHAALAGSAPTRP